ncbi:hypothetical protein OIO90_006195 [Microbotryomycetes sp. JL221]|nr:hypothetical protein OIO90_006195 [Microbotryomycetes sp. JL221]
MALSAVLLAALVQLSGLTTWFHHNLMAPRSFPNQLATFPPFKSTHPNRDQLEYLLIRASSSSDSDEFRSCEDVTELDHQHVIVSCDPSRHEWNTVMGVLRKPEPKGSLWIVNPTHTRPVVAHKLDLINWPQDIDFHPLGIRVLDSRLFVINHRRDKSTIEVFQISKTDDTSTSLHYMTTISHPSLTGAPNALEPITQTSLWVTHDHKYNKRSTNVLVNFLNSIETIFARPWSKVDLVTFEDPPIDEDVNFSTNQQRQAIDVKVKTVARSIAFANGIAYSRQHNVLAVASSTRKIVHMYNVDNKTLQLTKFDNVKVPFLVDNLGVVPNSFFNQEEQESERNQNQPCFVATGHPAYLPLLLESRNISISKWLPQAASWSVLLSRRPRSTTTTTTLDESETPIMSIQELKDIAYTSERTLPTRNWKLQTLFISKGGSKHDDKAFGMSTTTVVGVDQSNGHRWIVLSGLYEKGLKLVREI